MKSILFICGLLLASGFSNPLFSQRYKVLLIRNCQQEMRTVTFDGQVWFFQKWFSGRSDFRQQSILHFSPGYHVDTGFLYHQIEKMRKSVPADFASSRPTGGWYNNVPDEPAIWFTVLFASQDQKGVLTAYAAYTVSFDGNNAHIDEQRMNPAITNVEFIFDKVALQKLAQRIKTLPEAR